MNDGLGASEEEGIRFLDLGGSPTRAKRMLVAIPLAWWRARKLKHDIYHFHDPELMLVGLALGLEGREVIYDVHEDLPNDIRNKPWIPSWLQTPLSLIMENFEKFVSKRMAATVCTTPHIAQRFQSYGGVVETVRNFPGIGGDIVSAETLNAGVGLDKDNDVGRVTSDENGLDNFKLVYAGTIAKNRGVVEMVEAVHQAGCRLVLMGVFREPDVYQELVEVPAWQSVDYLGVVDKERVELEYSQCHAGIAYFHPDVNYVNALPIKLFEYMRYKLPVICSDFETWRQIYENTGACLFVEPCDTDKLRDAIVTLKEDRNRAREMGERGQAVVFTDYNWESEFSKLELLYSQIMPKTATHLAIEPRMDQNDS